MPTCHLSRFLKSDIFDKRKMSIHNCHLVKVSDIDILNSLSIFLKFIKTKEYRTVLMGLWP